MGKRRSVQTMWKNSSRGWICVRRPQPHESSYCTCFATRYFFASLPFSLALFLHLRAFVSLFFFFFFSVSRLRSLMLGRARIHLQPQIFTLNLSFSSTLRRRQQQQRATSTIRVFFGNTHRQARNEMRFVYSAFIFVCFTFDSDSHCYTMCDEASRRVQQSNPNEKKYEILRDGCERKSYLCYKQVHQ